MKVFLAFVAFIIWMLVSLALALSIIGLYFIVMMDDEWIKIGKELVSTIKSE